ncbi:hypothetical protein H7U05_03685 [Priestia megaterium]|uniref:hypothetical protein n=1 Tax=Priestia megaterium TaxID=1404 RepID=UPI001C8E08FD|nr:hypothetical protein [Priestia megaterium]MBY0196405.1 hypothetical protein [Priestia megaterium]
MSELIKALPSLLGVIVGGLITFWIQQITIRKQQSWEKEKLNLDNFYKGEATKFKTFNKILQLHAENTVLEIDVHDKPVLNQTNYIEHIRPLLFEVYHLLNEDMAKEIDFIEDVLEQQSLTGHRDEVESKDTTDSYLKVLNLIRQEFKSLRASKKDFLSV